MKYTTYIALILACALSFPAQAKKVKKLTDNNVKTFIETMIDMTEPDANQSYSPQEINTYLGTHIADTARYQSTVLFAIPGFPPESNELSVSKKDYIQQIVNSKDVIKNHEAQTTIHSITVSRSGKAAIVETHSEETGLMTLPSEEINQTVEIDGITKCSQRIQLSRKGIIQSNGATCKTEISFSEF